MKKIGIENTRVKIPSRREFINTAGQVAGGAILGGLTLMSSCSLLESITQSMPAKSTLPTRISSIIDLAEVRTALDTEKVQLASLIDGLTRFQDDVNGLDALMGQLSRATNSLSDLSDETSFKLQECMEQKSQIESTLSNILKVFENTQSTLVANVK